MKKLIIVVPCYREEASLPHTIKELQDVINKIKKYSIDILLVNDGSPDKTLQVIKEMSEKYSNLYYISFSKNAGHQSALRAGLSAALDYDATIMMDADLQHPPKLIPDMIEQWENGFSIVQMTRQDEAKEIGAFKLFIRRSYYRLINSISEIKLEYGASDFRLVDQAVIATLSMSPEKKLFLRGYFSWLPASRTTIEYVPNKRIAGTSNYTLKKLLQLTYTSILQFSEKPLRISVSLGVIVALASFLYGVFIVIGYLTGLQSVNGWTSLMTAILFCFGVNFIVLGIIGHYLGHISGLAKNRPEYIISEARLRK